MENNTHKNPLNKKKIILFIVYSFIAVCLLFAVLSMNDISAINEQLKTVDFKYIWLAIISMLGFILTFPLSLCILTRARKCDIKMTTTYSIAMTEHFFNGITPLSTGGQPFQAYSFHKARVKVSESTGLLLTNLLIYMIVTSAFALMGLFYFDILCAHMDSWWIPIVIIGYALDILVLTVTFSLGASKKLRAILMRFIYFLCKFRLFKKLESKADGIKAYFEQVQDAFHDLTKKKGSFALALISKIIAYAFYYASSYFILLSLHIPMEPSHMMLTISGTAFAITAVGFIPTPGASGGVEGSMGQIFRSIVIFIAGSAIIPTATAIANGVMLIWRLLSYYFVMLVSLVFYIGLEIYFSKKAKKADITTDEK